MPLSSNQLATLVERARHRAPPVVSPPTPSPPRSVRQRRDASAAPAAARPQLRSEVPTLTPEAPVARALPPQPEKPAPLPAEPATPDDHPWFLDKSSWRFHRRFYAVFRRPMQRGNPTPRMVSISSAMTAITVRHTCAEDKGQTDGVVAGRAVNAEPEDRDGCRYPLTSSRHQLTRL